MLDRPTFGELIAATSISGGYELPHHDLMGTHKSSCPSTIEKTGIWDSLSLGTTRKASIRIKEDMDPSQAPEIVIAARVEDDKVLWKLRGVKKLNLALEEFHDSIIGTVR